jgi:hypothetical protein
MQSSSPSSSIENDRLENVLILQAEVPWEHLVVEYSKNIIPRVNQFK